MSCSCLEQPEPVRHASDVGRRSPSLVFRALGADAGLDTLMVFVGGIAHFVLISACLGAIIYSCEERKWRSFVLGGVVALVYFAVIVAVARPR
ncbi:MAG TPA: hypothetical protein VJQ54_08355 [Candidatus Sulfotelmatobacter sp.]|nr:hypothetical protein [Candidatus Sulfotelmatobacter sp.]